MIDIVERLKDYASPIMGMDKLAAEAANEIERLRAERDNWMHKWSELKADIEQAEQRAKHFAVKCEHLKIENAALKAKLKDVLKAAPCAVACENFHHSKKDHHDYIQDCPCVTRYHNAIDEAMKGEK